MEEELLALETTDIWENIGDMMEEEFEDRSTATADPGPDLEEARLRFQLKFDEKTRQLEKSKMLLEEATTTLKKVKHLKKSYDDDEDVESDELEISCLEEQMKTVETEKRREKGVEDENHQFFKDTFLGVSSLSFLKSPERKTVDVKVPKDTTDINKSEPQQ